MTQDSKKPLLKGEAAVIELRKFDERVKAFRATTFDVAEGVVTPTGETITGTWHNERTGQSGEFPCFRCTDSQGKTHDIALTALMDKDPIFTTSSDGKVTLLHNGKGIFPMGLLPSEIFLGLLEAIKTKNLYLTRYYGKRGNFRGNYEVFSLVEKPATKTKNK